MKSKTNEYKRPEMRVLTIGTRRLMNGSNDSVEVHTNSSFHFEGAGESTDEGR